MGFTPYDWNENIQHRVDYVETRLREGSPVVGLTFSSGVLILSVRRTQRKVFEVFDHILYSAMGSQSDVEAIRIASIDFAHQEGFNRSPDDVSVQRMVAGLSPTLKKAFTDGFSAPFIFRGLFAELGREPGRDGFTTLGYDGDYAVHSTYAAVAGSSEAERKMNELLSGGGSDRLPLPDALRLGIRAWAAGRAAVAGAGFTRDEGEEHAPEAAPEAVLSKALEDGSVEVGTLERQGPLVRFRILPPGDAVEAVQDILHKIP
jgi:proteasome alpha subunit